MSWPEPAGHRVVVKPDDVQERTESGIYLPPQGIDRKKAEMTTGELVAVGRNAWKAFDDGAPWAEVGDTVIYAKYGGYSVRDEDGGEYRILNDEDIVGIKSRRVS